MEIQDENYDISKEEPYEEDQLQTAPNDNEATHDEDLTSSAKLPKKEESGQVLEELASKNFETFGK